MLADTAIFRCDRADTGSQLPCRIQLAPYDYTKALLSVRYGEPIEIPLGRYEIRAAAPGFSLARNVSYTASEEMSKGTPHNVRLSLVPGGLLYVDPAAVPSPGAVQLLSFPTGKTDVLFVDREREIPVPAGKLLAVGLRSPGQFLGATPIVEVKAGQRTVITRFDKPLAERSNVLIRGDYIGDAAAPEKDVAITLLSSGGRYEALAATNAADGSHYSVFYGVPSGPKTLEIRSRVWRADSIDLDVPRASFVFKDDLHLVTKPSLTVRPVISGGTNPPRWKVTVYSCKEFEFGPGSTAWPSLDGCTEYRMVESAAAEAQVSYLDATWYFVLTEVDGQRIGRQIDLRSGQDRVEYFEFKRHRIAGVVRRGERGIAAELKFENYDTGDRGEEVASGPDGTYEAVLWQKGIYRVSVRPRDAEPADAAIYQLSVEGEESIRRDFVVPTGRVRLLVLNETTSDPIPGASVFFSMAGASEEKATNELGEVKFPPLAPGPFRLFAKAEGYERKDVTFEVLESGDEQRWDVRLKPVDDSHSFHAVLPGGTPAVSAVVLWNLDSTGRYRSRQECDAAGLCRLAERPGDGELLYVVHRDAGLTVLPAGRALHDKQVRLRPKGGPLVLQIRRGEESSAALLSARILLDGSVVPPYALETIANLVGEPFRIHLHPGVQQPIVIAGLPAGTPVSVGILMTGGGSDPQEVPTLVVQLPTQPMELRLP